MAFGRLAKDVHNLQKNIGAQTDGQAEVADVDDNLEFVLLNIFPSDGFYEGAKLRFKIKFDPEGYPEFAPTVQCLDKVYHPNIDFMLEDQDSSDSSNVCVSLLDEWEPSMDLDHIVMALLFILYNPNPEDALSPYFDSDINEEELAENIRQSLSGGVVEGDCWPCLLAGDAHNLGGEGMKPNDDGSVTDNKQTGGNSAEALSSLDEVSEKTTASVTGSAPLPDSGLAKDSDDQNQLVATSSGIGNDVSKLSLSNTEICSHQKSVWAEVINQTLKDRFEIPLELDVADCDRKNSVCECYSNSLGIGRLLTCGFCSGRPLSIRALFSCFHGTDAARFFHSSDIGIAGDLWDCDVD